MEDSIDWTTHVVLACITCEAVSLLTRPNNTQRAAREASRKFMQLIPVDPSTDQSIIDRTVNLFLPTVCRSCNGSASWTSISISRNLIDIWQPFLAMRAFLEADLSIFGSSISVVDHAEVIRIASSDYKIQSVVVSGAKVVVQQFLKSGFF
jgi:hypothetical protein